MNTDAYTFLDVRKKDGVAFITFDSAETNNQYSRSQKWELADVIEQAGRDDDVRVVLVTGRGEFFGGGSHHDDDPFSPDGYYERAAQLFRAWANLDKPIVVAVNGPATMTLPLLSDIVIAEEHVDFRDGHVTYGIVSATGSYLWPPSVGLAKAKRYLLSGDSLPASEAERIGLISEVVPTGTSLAKATELAVRIAALPPSGVQGTKRAINLRLRQEFDTVLQHGLALEFMRFPVEAMGYTRETTTAGE